MKVSSSCMFHLGSRVSLYLSAKSGWCDHEVSGTRKSFLLTTFGQICSQELSRSVFGLQDFFIKLPLLSPRTRLFYWSKVGWFKYSDIAKDCLLTGQEQACKRITWSFFCSGVTMPKMAHYTGKRLLTAPLWSYPVSTVKPFSTPDKTSKEGWVVQPSQSFA